jgi:hypothetical protein
MTKPQITPHSKGGFRIRWHHPKHKVWYTINDRLARTEIEAWSDAAEFFEQVGCTEEPELPERVGDSGKQV